MTTYSPAVVSKLPKSPTSLGLVARFVAFHAPFDKFDFGPVVKSIFLQLDQGTHLIATRNDLIVGYVGWLRTSEAIARNWLESDEALTFVEDGPAAAVTILAVDSAEDIKRLIRAAKNDEADASVYWKRYYTDGRGPSARRVVKNEGR